MTWTDEQARERGHRLLTDPANTRVNGAVVVGRALLDLEARCKALEQERDDYGKMVDEAHNDRDTALRERDALAKAIAWALGEVDEFPPRMEGEPAYWWRTELRRRAALAAAPEGAKHPGEPGE